MKKLTAIIILAILASGLLAMSAQAAPAVDIPAAASRITGANDPAAIDTDRLTTGIPIIPEGSYPTLLMWYCLFGSLGAAFVFLMLVRSGYTLIFSAVNPGERASFTVAIQRAILGVLAVAVMPAIFSLLIDTNNALVATVATQFVSGNATIAEGDPIAVADVLSTMFNAIPTLLVKTIGWIFDMHAIDAILFNGSEGGVWNMWLTSIYDINTGNVLSDTLINAAMLIFELYFNIFYIVRQWTFSLLFVVTPLILWTWVLAGRSEVLTTWAWTMITKIFIQTIHATCFALIFSILGSSSSSPVDVSIAVKSMMSIGQYLAGFAGLVAVGIMVALGYRMMFSGNERDMAAAKAGITKALAGLGVCVLAFALVPILIGSGVTPVSAPIDSGALGGAGEISLLSIFIALATVIAASKMVTGMLSSAFGAKDAGDVGDIAGRMMGSTGQLLYRTYRIGSQMSHKSGGLPANDKFTNPEKSSMGGGNFGGAGFRPNQPPPNNGPSGPAAFGPVDTNALAAPRSPLGADIGQSLRQQTPAPVRPNNNGGPAPTPRSAQPTSAAHTAQPAQQQAPRSGSSFQPGQHAPAGKNNPVQRAIAMQSQTGGSIALPNQNQSVISHSSGRSAQNNNMFGQQAQQAAPTPRPGSNFGSLRGEYRNNSPQQRIDDMF